MKKSILSALAVTAMCTAIGTNANAASITIEKGDTLWDLSRQYNVTIDQLKEWNGLSNDTIYANKTLTISMEEANDEAVATQTKNTSAATEMDADGNYIVVKGDTLSKIAKQFGVSVSTLKSWNGLTGDLIYANQSLVVANGTAQAVPETTEATQTEQTVEAAETTATSENTAQAQEPQQQEAAVAEEQTETASTTASSAVKTLTVEATAYTALDGGGSGVTAAGIDLVANPNAKVIAVDPSVIPLGTKVYVEGYGEAIAGDTGGAIKGNKIDVYVQTKSEAYAWGRKQVTVQILE